MIKKIIKNPQAIIGFIMIVLVCIIALFAQFIAPHDPNTVNTNMKFLHSSVNYPLGTDQLGRCVFSRLVYGTRYSLGVSIPILLILSLIGTILGTISGYFNGWFDKILNVICNIFMAFPPLVIVLALIGVLGQGALNLIISIILSMWVWFVRVTRSYILMEKNKSYVIAAKISGCTTYKILFHHILPNIFSMMIVYFSTSVSSIILMISGYSFLGLGFGTGVPEWGAMLNNAKQFLYTNPLLIVYPGLCILFTAAGFNLFGEALRNVLSPQGE